MISGHYSGILSIFFLAPLNLTIGQNILAWWGQESNVTLFAFGSLQNSIFMRLPIAVLHAAPARTVAATVHHRIRPFIHIQTDKNDRPPRVNRRRRSLLGCVSPVSVPAAATQRRDRRDPWPGARATWGAAGRRRSGSGCS